MFILSKVQTLIIIVAFVFTTLNTYIAGAEETELTEIMVVFDASGSMWGQFDGRTKIEVARDVFENLSSDWAAESINTGLIAYGHRRKGDCGDIEVISTPSAGATAGLANHVSSLIPKGKTPISKSIEKAAEVLKFTENKATVVLLSDGIETCNLDACKVAQDLEALGVDFTAHVIGLGIDKQEERAQLQCIAQSTGGQYFDAKDANSLNDALREVTQTTDNEEKYDGNIELVARYKLIDDASRPAWVVYTATNLDTQEVRTFDKTDQTDQIIQGQQMSLSAGKWKFSLRGDAGYGEIEMVLTGTEEFIDIPYAANKGTFEFLDKGPFLVGENFQIRVKALTQLEANATYTMWLFPENSTSFDQNITYFSRFGSDQGTIEHTIWAGEQSYPAGNYEIIIKNTDDYEIDNNIGSFKFSLVDELSQAISPDKPMVTSESETESKMDKILITLQYADGSAPQGATSWSFLRKGDTDVRAPTTVSTRATFPDFEYGTYEVDIQVDTETGLAFAQTQIVVSPDGPNKFLIVVEHETNGHDLNTDEIQPNESQSVLDIWKRCKGTSPCSFQDRRVDLVWTMPPQWVTEEPYYYTTAGGAQASRPTLMMGTRLNSKNTFRVALNPRQWDATQGPCEQTGLDQICRFEYTTSSDQKDYQLILSGLKEQGFGAPISQGEIDKLLELATGEKS